MSGPVYRSDYPGGMPRLRSSLRARGSRTAWWGAVTAVLAGAALVLGAAPSRAAGTTPSPSSPSEPPATVELASATSSYLVDGTDLILAGAVTNGGSEPLGRVNVTLRHSRDALEDRADVRRVATDDEFRVGRRDVTHFVPIGDLEPGHSQPFSLTVPVDDLRLADAGVYVVGVDVSATTSDGSRETVAARSAPSCPSSTPIRCPRCR